MELSIVIPAYNEEKRIKPTLLEVGRYFNNSDIEAEVIVVVNNSTDRTADIVRKISDKYPFIKLLEIKRFTGKGGAISRGVKLGRGKYIAYQDADGSSKVTDLIKGYKKLLKNPELDIVMGSRYLGKSVISGDMPSYRFVLSRMFNFAVRVMFGLHFADTQCAVKVMRRSVAKKLLKVLTANRWTVDVNILIDAKFNGYRVVEFPIKWVAMAGSKLNVSKAFREVGVELLSLKIYQVRKLFKLSMEKWKVYFNLAFKN